MRDNNTLSIMPWYAPALGFVRLDVALADRDAAQRILADLLGDHDPLSPADGQDLSALAEAGWRAGRADATANQADRNQAAGQSDTDSADPDRAGSSPPVPHRFADDPICPRCGGPAEWAPMNWLRAVVMVALPMTGRAAHCPACHHHWRDRGHRHRVDPHQSTPP